MTQTQQPQFQSPVVAVAYATLFEGGGKKPQHIDGALHVLLDRAETDPEANSLLKRAQKEGKFSPGKAKKRLIELMDKRRKAYEAERREASKAKQAKNAQNRKEKGAEQSLKARSRPSGGGKSQNEGKKGKKGH